MEEVEARAKQTSTPVKQLARQAEPLGVTEEQLVALPDYERSCSFSEEERAVLRYADAMTRTSVHVPNALFDALKACYTDRQILEITAAIAWENFHARVNHALELEAEGVAGRVCPVPDQGPPPKSTAEEEEA